MYDFQIYKTAKQLNDVFDVNPKSWTNNTVKFDVNEFGIVPDSFRLVLDLFFLYSSSLCTLSDSGRIRPLSQTFQCCFTIL